MPFRTALVASLGCLFACSGAARPSASSSDAGAGSPGIVENPQLVPQNVVGSLRGKVLAPDGKMPLAGAVVSLWSERPAARPSGLVCDKCVEMPRNVPFATSAADGTFELPVRQTGTFFLSVQKGGFRRVRAIDLISGEQEAPAVLATLPAKPDEEDGDEIPKMAVVKGEFDPIEVSLAKLGLGRLVNGEVDTGSLPFDFYDDPSLTGPKSGTRLLADPALLSKYQVVFLPCSGTSGTTCNDERSLKPEVQSALKDFVEGGGRLYVTDYSYEFVRQLWPGTLSWKGESAAVGSACENVSYDAPAVVDDTGLDAWLGALGHGSVTLQKSWTTLSGVHEVEAKDAFGKMGPITPRVWMSAKKSDGAHPATVSFERGCGRVLFSTYHTAGAAKEPLLPQEKALLYVLFEAITCVGDDPLK